jgi:hypothetical protein
MQNRFITAGKELLKLNFGNAAKSLMPQSEFTGPIDTADYKGNAWWFFGNDGVDYPFTYDNRNSALKAYQLCPPVAAIINRKAQAYINGKTWIMNTRGKEAQTVMAAKLKKLFTTPNPLQSWREFEAQTYIYQQIFGFAIWLPMIPTGYKEYGPIEATAIWNIPPFMVEIEEHDTVYFKSGGKSLIKRITLNYRNTKTDIDPESVFIIKDFTPSFNSLVIPDSRIMAMKMPINNIIGAMESENVIINKRGPAFIISGEQDKYGTGSVRPDEKTELQKEFERYGIRKQQAQAIFTSAAIKYQAIGSSMRDLMLHESVKENTKCVCDGLNYPPHLLGLIDPTFNNQNAAEKGLYNNAIIPEANSNYEQINQVFRTVEYNINIQKDYSHVPVLQEDARLEAAARRIKGQALELEFKNNWITLNRVLELLGEDTIGAEGDRYYRDINPNALGVDESGNLLPITTTQNNGQG